MRVLRTGLKLATLRPKIAAPGGGGGGALWRANEPTGMTTVTDRPYDAQNELGWADTWSSDAFITSDAGAPQSPSNIFRCFYGATRNDSSAPAAWDPPGLSQKRTVYSAHWFKFSSNWQGHNSGTNKLYYHHA